MRWALKDRKKLDRLVVELLALTDMLGKIIEIFDDGGDDKETAADVDGNLLQEAGAMRNNTEGPSTIKNPRIYAGN